MSTATTTSTKSASRFIVDFINKKIIGTRASFNKASKGFGPEYEELTSKVNAHPDFELAVKEQKRKTTKAKRTYDGLNFDFMEAYIATLKNAKAVSEEYQAVKVMAKKCGTKTYPLTKKWFLDKFSTKEAPFNMDEAKEAINEYRINFAKANIAELLPVVSAETAVAQDKMVA